MSFEVCPKANESCPYWAKETPESLKGKQENGCRSDRDHRSPQRLAKGLGKQSLEHLYIYSPENTQQLCRNEHDKKTREGDEPLPDRDYMLERVQAQITSGALKVSRKLKIKIMKGKIA